MDAVLSKKRVRNASKVNKTIVFPVAESKKFSAFVKPGMVMGKKRSHQHKFTYSEVAVVAVRLLRALGPDIARTFAEKYEEGDDDYFERIGRDIRRQL